MKAYKIIVTGVVQGVGFRPFIYRLAVSLGLKGYVKNLGGGSVEIHVEGDSSRVREFIERLRIEKPPPARIENVDIVEDKEQGFKSFVIEKSSTVIKRSIIPPDIGICSECLKEIKTNGTRFTRYYWNSCAWCGPRFSMMYKTPYDRENTSMRVYKLCNECYREYNDPSSIRRFHAQGISCLKCGPRTSVYSINGDKIDVNDPVKFASRVIEEGSIVAIKGVGGYHIACLASRDDVVEELRRRKNRPTKPFAIMARDYSIVEEIANPPPEAREVLESPERPIILLPKKEESKLSELVAPGLDTVGVMLPYTGFQYLLLDEVKDHFLIMTSGNRRGRPMCRDLECVFKELSDIVDYVVDHDREIVHRVDDSVLRYTDGELVFIRRSRGYAPAWIRAKVRFREGVGVGGELQMAGGVCFEDKLVLTQFIGDLDEPGQLEELEREIKWFIKNYDLKPEFIALDMHPLYHNRSLAIKLAEEYGAELIKTQHHHAHASSVMLEYGVETGDYKTCITIDGVGWGDDDSIWGGEVLVSSYESYDRVGFIEPYPLPGGDAAVVSPVKPLIALLAKAGFSEDEVINVLKERGVFSKLRHGVKEALLTYRIAKHNLAVKCSSLGRVLDAISAMLGVCLERTYEGEPAMKLEAYANGGVDLGYTPPVRGSRRKTIVVTKLVEWVLDSLKRRRLKDIALTIQKGLGRALAEVALEEALDCGRIVYASGGASVNTYIIRGAREILSESGIRLLLPKKLPPGDGGLAAGQCAIASSKL